MINLTELDNGVLRISLDCDYPDVKMEIRKLIRNESLIGGIYTLLDGSGYLGNGWDVADDVFALSSAVCIFYDLDRNDNGDYVFFDKAWHYPDEVIRHPLMILLAQGFVDYLPLSAEDYPE